MVKTKSLYVCQECGAKSPSWIGQCSVCQSWNTFNLVDEQKSGAHSSAVVYQKPIPCDDVAIDDVVRLPSHIGELDLVLGGGFVPGSAVLLGGEPGIGKSTFALQIALNMAQSGQKVLYISAEESASQLLIRAKRIGVPCASLLIFPEHDLAAILTCIKDEKPNLIILDSIQLVADQYHSSIEGSVSQVRLCAGQLINLIKNLSIVAILIGHVTKDGQLAGPKVLEHMVDVIFYIEGEREQRCRVLRSYKNRYHNTQDIGLFEMSKDGLKELSDPFFCLVNDQSLNQPGAVIAPVQQGHRVMMVELQALVVKSGFGPPKRNVVGVSIHRVQLMVAILEKKCRIPLSTYDIYINLVGGIAIQEPALDLAIVMAILSSYKEVSLPKYTGFIGEVGLAGEVRQVPNLDKRLRAMGKLGFRSCYVSNLVSKGQFSGCKTMLIDHIYHLLTLLDDTQNT